MPQLLSETDVGSPVLLSPERIAPKIPSPAVRKFSFEEAVGEGPRRFSFEEATGMLPSPVEMPVEPPPMGLGYENEAQAIRESIGRISDPFHAPFELPRFDRAMTAPRNVPLDVAGGLYNLGATATEAVASPVGVGTAALGAVGPIMRALLGMGWGAEMLRTTPDVAREAGRAISADAPLPEKVEKTGLAVLQPILGALGIRHGLQSKIWPNLPITPEVLPPKMEVGPVRPRPRGPEGPVIDVETVPTGLLPGPRGLFLPPAKTYQTGQPVPIEQALAAGAVPSAAELAARPQYVPREQVVRPSQGPPAVIGGEPRPPRQVFFVPPEQQVEPGVAATKEPLETTSGLMSFLRPAAPPGATPKVSEQEALMRGAFVPAAEPRQQPPAKPRTRVRDIGQRTFPPVPKPEPPKREMPVYGREPQRIPIKIQDPQGNIREGEFTGYYDLSFAGKPPLASIGWTLPTGYKTHGTLAPGEKIIGEVPTFEEWKAGQGGAQPAKTSLPAPAPQPPPKPKGKGIGGGIQAAMKKGKKKGSILNPVQLLLEKLKKKDIEKRSGMSLTGPQLVLNPKRVGYVNPDKPVDALQLYNRVKAKLKQESPTEWQFYKDKLPQTGKITPAQAAEIMSEAGPVVKSSTYGMKSKEERGEEVRYGELVHQWFDNLKQSERVKVDQASEAYLDPESRFSTPKEALEDFGVATPEAIEYLTLKEKTVQRSYKSPRTNPKATSYYEQISPKDVDEFPVERDDLQFDPQKMSVEPDDIHTALFNTAGWTASQRLEHPKTGEELDVIFEHQAHWEQERKKDVLEREDNNEIWRKLNLQSLAESDNFSKSSGSGIWEPSAGSWYDFRKGDTVLLKVPGNLVDPLIGSPSPGEHELTPEMKRKLEPLAQMLVERSDKQAPPLTPNHPLLEDTSRLLLKNKIEKARAKGDKSIAITDADSALLTELLWDPRNLVAGRPPQEKKLRQHYDEVIPRIMEKLTGSKGELVNFGTHKNWTNKPDALHDFRARVYPIPASEKLPSLLKKDNPATREQRLYGGFMGLDPELIKQTAKDVGRWVNTGVEKYTEPLVDSLRGKGGPTAERVTDEARKMVSRGKRLLGELTPTLNRALVRAGKAYRGGTTWLRDYNEVTENSAFNNFFGAAEGAVTVPPQAQRGLKTMKRASQEINAMFRRANPGLPGGSQLHWLQTSFGYDLIINGGDALTYWQEGLSKLNNVPQPRVKQIFDKWREALLEPWTDSATFDQINKELRQLFPRTITHVRSGGGWHQVVTADPFNYLDSAAKRAASLAAFREVYPLVQNPRTGWWVSSGKLNRTRKALSSELKRGGDVEKFDDLIRALQGFPLDTFKGIGSGIAQAVGGTVKPPLQAMMLSLNAVANLPETIVGAPQQFLGYKNISKAVARLIKDGTFREQLQLSQMRNKVFHNLAMDPTSPARSLARQFATGVRKITGQQMMNELQEILAAAGAKVYTDRIVSGDMSRYELNRAKALFRQMGYTKPQAEAMVNGDRDLLNQFENQAANWLAAGNQAEAELSRLGASRLFNSAVWFQRYPMMTSNHLKRGLGVWAEEARDFAKKPSKEGASSLWHNSVLLARQLAGKTTQGMWMTALMALATGGAYGLYTTLKEAQDQLGWFAFEGLLSGYAGPLAYLKRVTQNAEGGDDLIKEVANLSPVVSVGSEVADMFYETGKYQGKSKMEKVGLFLESKTPISKSIRVGLATAGITEHDIKFDAGLKAFYKWRREQPGYQAETTRKGKEKQIDIRTAAKTVKKLIRDGGDWVKELERIKELPDVKKSLQAGTMLEFNGAPLDEKQLASLRKRIGSDMVDHLRKSDAMVRELARSLTDVEDVKTVAQPTGTRAIDLETSSQRSERVLAGLDKPTQELLTKNQIQQVDYTPDIGTPKVAKLLSEEQGRMMETNFIKSIQESLQGLTNNPSFNELPLAGRKDIIQKRLARARKMAKGLTRQEVE